MSVMDSLSGVNSLRVFRFVHELQIMRSHVFHPRPHLPAQMIMTLHVLPPQQVVLFGHTHVMVVAKNKILCTIGKSVVTMSIVDALKLQR